MADFAIQSHGYVGPVGTCCSLSVELGTHRAHVLLVAVGADLHALSSPAGASAASHFVDSASELRFLLGTCHVHGLCPKELGPPGPRCVVAFGPHALRLFEVTQSPQDGVAMKACGDVVRLPDWPLDVAWLPKQFLGDLVVAYGRVFLEIWRLGDEGPRRQRRLAGPAEVSFLYSASLQLLPIATDSGMRCAGGTFDGFAVLWTVPHSACTELAHVQLSGHEGAIFRTRLFLDATALLTASDDRTVRLWVEEGSPLLRGAVGSLRTKVPSQPSPGWRCVAICRGHGCRVWDAVLAPIGGPSLGIVSASEDSIVRVFSLEGVLLRELQGHQTRGVRCLEVVVEPMAWASTAFAQADLAVISGGEDGAVKLWPLCDLGIPEGDGSSKAGYPAKHACSKLWHVPQAEDWIREVALLSHSEALVATNFGKIYRLLLCAEDAKDAGEQVPARLLFDEPGVCFTCMGVGTSTHVWTGCADGRALFLCIETDAGSKWVEAFRQYRVSAAFGGGEGQGLLADHAGHVQLWRGAGSESPSRLGEVKLAAPRRGDKDQRQRLLCAEFLPLDGGGPSWLVGDEHGILHLVNLPGPCLSHRGHEGKVLCLRRLPVSREFLSAGSDGTVVHHRLDQEGWTQLATHRLGCGLRHLAHLSLLSPDFSGPGIPPLLVGAFQSADFVLWNAGAGLEIWRRRCGGAKRPNGLIADEAAHTFVFSSASKTLEIHSTYASPAVSGSSDAHEPGVVAPKGLRQPLHGREIHSTCWLRPPSEGRPGLLATASEDTSLRLLSAGRDVAPTPESASVRFPGAVRALAAAKVVVAGQESCLLLSGGAKGVLQAHMVEGAASLRRVWSTSLAEDAAAADHVAEEEDGGARLEERVMAIGCVTLEASLLVCAAASSGLLRSWRLRFGPAGSIEGDFLQRQRAADTTALCAECFLEQGFAGVLVGSADGKLAAAGLAESEPLLRTQLHDAGLNHLALRVLRSDVELVQLLLLTAGDDHRVALCRLDFAISRAPSPGAPRAVSCALAMSRRVDCAHTSAARAVGWAGPWALSLGLDRRLRVWEALEDSCALTERAAQVVSCSEPEALAVTAGGLLALAGRGVEVSSILVDGLRPD